MPWCLRGMPEGIVLVATLSKLAPLASTVSTWPRRWYLSLTQSRYRSEPSPAPSSALSLPTSPRRSLSVVDGTAPVPEFGLTERVTAPVGGSWRGRPGGTAGAA